jgi:hypothetical protein
LQCSWLQFYKYKGIMKIYRFLIFYLLLLVACSSSLNSKPRSHQLKVDKIHIGMTLHEMKSLYPGAEFIEEPLFKYGVDSENNGIKVAVNEESLFFIWTLEDNDTINGIEILSQNIVIDHDVHVGMTLEDFLRKYPDSKLAFDELSSDYEFIQVPGPDYRVEFLTTDSTRVANYNYSGTEPEFISVKRPAAKIDRISIMK